MGEKDCPVNLVSMGFQEGMVLMETLEWMASLGLQDRTADQGSMELMGFQELQECVDQQALQELLVSNLLY